MKKNSLLTNLVSVFAVLFILSSMVDDATAQSSARGGKNKSRKITICHIPPGNPDNAHTIVIDESAWEAHAAHGDSRGKCDNERKTWNKKDKITICHFPPGNPDNVQRITIATDAWPAHEAHGDVIGDDCDKDDDDEEPATPPSYLSCNDLSDGASLFSVSNSTKNGNNIHGLWMPNLFGDGKTILFDFVSGQLTYDENTAKVWGIVKLRNGDDDDDDDDDLEGLWYVNFDYTSTDIIDPKLETGQGPELYNTWAYFMMNAETSTLTKASDNSEVVTFRHRGNPFAVGLGASNKDNSEWGASAWFYWNYDNREGVGDININVTDLCPTEDVTAVLETDDEEICLGENTTLNISFTGEGPWTLYYSIGDESYEVTGIETREYALPVSVSGLYILTGVSDVNGNQGEAIGEVLILSPPTAIFEEGGAVCEGSELELKVILGGEGPWTFTYSDGQETNTLTSDENIATVITTTPGEYRIVSVTNGNCETTGSEEVVIVELVETGSVEISGGGDIYNGETTTIDFNMSGVGPWTITYTDGTDEFTFTTEENTYSIEVSKAGTYSIVSVEGGSCIIPSGSGEVVVYELPTAQLIIEDTEVCKDENESLKVTFTGSGPWDLTYSIDGENVVIEDIQDSEFTTPLSSSGEYRIVNVTDVNGREGRGDGEFDVKISEIPFATIGGGGIICPGDEAQIEITLGGDGPWTFTYSDGIQDYTVESDEPLYTFNTSEPGEYRIRTITSGNCSIEIEDVVAVVEVNETATAALSGVGEIYAGETATLVFEMTGQGPFVVEYTDGTNTYNFTTDQQRYEVQVDDQGLYQITDFQANGCSFVSSGEVTVYELPTAELNIQNTELCANDNESLNISFTGNGPWDLTYSIDGTNVVVENIQNSNFSTGISTPGEYKIVNVSDVNGRQGRVSGQFDVDISEVPFATISGGGTICPNEETQIEITLGGEGPWTFTYSDGQNDFTVDSDQPVYTFTTAEAGEYRIRTITSGNCFVEIQDAVAVVEVNEIATAELSGVGDYYSGETATLVFEMTGQGPFNVEYTDGNDSYNFTTSETRYELQVATQGLYEITDFSAAGCTSTSSGDVNVYELSTASIASSNQNICEGDGGVLTFNLTGNGPWDVTYSVDGVNYTESGITNPQYTIDVTEGNDFRLVDVVDVNQRTGRAEGSMNINFLPLPGIHLTGGGRVCEGEQASVVFDLSGQGNGPWTVEYTDGTNNYSFTTTTPVYTASSGQSGQIEVLSVYNGSCTNNAVNATPVTIEVIETPTASINGSAEICPGETTVLNIDFTGTGPWTFVYTDGSTNFPPITTDEPQYQIPASNNGSYRVLSVNTNGCSNSGDGNAVIGVIESIANEGSLVTEESHCQGTEIFMTLNIPQGSDYVIDWVSTGDGDFSATNDAGAIYIPAATDENVTFTAIVTNRCETVEFSANTLIQMINSSFGILQSGDDILTNVDYEFQASDITADTYEWQFQDGTSYSGPTIAHEFTQSGTQSVSLTVGKGECTSTSIIQFDVLQNTNLYVPTAFNPTSTDPNNSACKVFGENVSFTGFHFEIRNRWGLVMYQTSSFEEANAIGWNGMALDGEPQENGVYTWILRGAFNDGEQFERTGTVTLVK